MDTTRAGYDLILSEIPFGARVLDLGCGDGVLLETLRNLRKIDGYGVELSAEGVSKCLEKGLYCYQGDIDDGLSDYRDNSFDYVILNQTLQDVKKPQFVLQEIMRICHNAIISFPNLGYVTTRLHLLSRGTMPKNSLFPYDWYASPTIHFLSIRDFQNYCAKHDYPVRNERHFSLRPGGASRLIRVMPNLCAQYGFFILNGRRFSSRKRT